ncbi:hypothetical protein [Desulfosporosinus sp. Sb-LF]|nr:hypothetical protein [Desulfosporosinus sp. Sb-LF]
MRMMKSKTSLLNPGMLALHVVGIGGAIWLGKAWERKTENY